MNDDGTLQVHLRTCGDRLDGATLYWPDDPNGDESNEQVFAEWAISPASDPTRADWRLTGPGTTGVTAVKPLLLIPEPPKNMALYAWTDDHQASAGGPSQFTTHDLTSLKPDEILVENTTGNSLDPSNKTVTRAEFDAIDCSEDGFG